MPPVRHVPSTPGPGNVKVFGVALDLAENDYIDAGSGTLTLSGASVESCVGLDSGSATLSLAASSTLYPTTTLYPSSSLYPGTLAPDRFVLSDSRTGALTLSGSGSTTTTRTSSASGTVMVSSGQVSESHIESGVSDSVDGSSIEFTLMGSTGTQSHSHSISTPGTLTSSGSRTEAATHSQTASGSVTLSGSGTQSHTHSSSPSGSLTLSTITTSLFAAYPADFYPGQVYPGQAIVAAENAVHSITVSSSATLTGDSSESYTTGGTVFTDSATGSISLDGVADELYGAPDFSGEGTIILGSTATLENPPYSWIILQINGLYVGRRRQAGAMIEQSAATLDLLIEIISEYEAQLADHHHDVNADYTSNRGARVLTIPRL